MGSEDVFDDDSENQTSLTFGSSDCTHKEILDNMCDQNRNCITATVTDRDKKVIGMEKETVDISLNANEVASMFQQSLKKLPEVVKRNESSETNDIDTGQKPKHEPFRDKVNEKKEITNNKDDSMNNNINLKPVAIPPKTLDIKADKDLKSGADSVAKISVNRSYAKGDSTFSIAVRSSSPYPPGFTNTLSADSNQIKSRTELCDLQNKNNNVIERRLQIDEIHQNKSSPGTVTWDNHVLELILLISGSTFLALCFDLPPWMFMLDILVALVIRVVLHILLREI